MSKEEILLNHNKMIGEIIEICNYMIENRYYMNGIAIRRKAEEIKSIAKFYLTEPKW